MTKRCAPQRLCLVVRLAAVVALFLPSLPQCHAGRAPFPPLVVVAFSATIGRRQRSSLPFSGGRNVGHVRCWSSSAQSPYDDETNYSDLPNQQVEYRPISDYVGGVHGGKYEFDPRLSGITSLNYEKSVLFGDVTTADAAGSATNVAPAPNFDDETSPPRWISRPVDYSNRVVNVLRLENDRAATVTIFNEELSWEPFYASLESSLTGFRISGDIDVRVAPSSGTLAPRGGANRYSDRARLQVHIISKPSFCNHGGGPIPEELYLVVRTECDVWTWRLIS